VRLVPFLSLAILIAAIHQAWSFADSSADFSDLRISEIYYDPPATNGIDGEAFEFIELENTGAAALDLGGVAFTGITATLAYPTVLGPGAFLVLARDPVRFSERFPDVLLDGVYAGKLNDAGETISLLDPSGTVITSVTYDDNRPWPNTADGAGLSLQRVNYAAEASQAANWIASVPTPGKALPTELIDTDTDHMPDLWESAHGFDSNDPTDAVLDSDGDGLSNLEEFLAGTDPRDAADCLRFTSARLDHAPRFQTIELTFNAAANHSYSVFYQMNGNDCWRAASQFESRPTNRTETLRYTILPLEGATLFHLVTPAQPPPPCDSDPD